MKTITAMVLIVVLVFGLVGCSRISINIEKDNELPPAPASETINTTYDWDEAQFRDGFEYGFQYGRKDDIDPYDLFYNLVDNDVKRDDEYFTWLNEMQIDNGQSYAEYVKSYYGDDYALGVIAYCTYVEYLTYNEYKDCLSDPHNLGLVCGLLTYYYSPILIDNYKSVAIIPLYRHAQFITEQREVLWICMDYIEEYYNEGGTV